MWAGYLWSWSSELASRLTDGKLGMTMPNIEQRVVLTNKMGLHARPSPKSLPLQANSTVR